MTEPVSKSSHAAGKEPRLDADDLFDVPVEALNLPGMDAADTATALAEFAAAEPAIATLAREAEPEPEPEPEQEPEQDIEPGEAEAPSPDSEPTPNPRRKWIAFGALALVSTLGSALVLSKSSTAPTPGVEVTPASAAETEPTSAEPNATEHEGAAHTNVAHNGAEHTRPEESGIGHKGAAHSGTAREVRFPSPSRNGNARLQNVEEALAAGRRTFARVELGRLLLDVDALPPAEREETRAQAELLVARILQDRADEARRSSR